MMYKYYELYKDSKNPMNLRKEIVQYALDFGIKPAARHFQTTVKTVRKWLRRWEENKGAGLKDMSKRPHNSPNQIAKYWYFKIQDICQTAIRDNKRIDATFIKGKYKIPYSTKCILKYMREFKYLRTKKTKTEKKRDMREVKELYRAFQKIQIDIKYLDDIPDMYLAYKLYKLPRYQITARCVRTGALYIGYSYEKSVHATSTFLVKLLNHLKALGVNLEECHIQTDNGTEFTAPSNTTKKALFTKIIEQIFASEHKTIPPGAKTYQSDVESSHRLIEDEFYAREYFYSKSDFLKKAKAYQHHFNFDRFNSYKKGTPKEILEKVSEINKKVLDFIPEIVDNEVMKTLEFYHSNVS